MSRKASDAQALRQRPQPHAEAMRERERASKSTSDQMSEIGALVGPRPAPQPRREDPLQRLQEPQPRGAEGAARKARSDGAGAGGGAAHAERPVTLAEIKRSRSGFRIELPCTLAQLRGSTRPSGVENSKG